MAAEEVYTGHHAVHNKGNKGAGENTFMQVNAGPVALSLGPLLKMIAVYSQILALYGDQTKWMIAAQTSGAKADAKSTASAGSELAKYALIGAALTIGMAVVSFGLSSGVGRNRSEMKDSSVELGKLGTESKGMDQIASLSKEVDAEAVPAEGIGPAVQRRMAEIRAGQYEMKSVDTYVNAPVGQGDNYGRAEFPADERLSDSEKLNRINEGAVKGLKNEDGFEDLTARFEQDRARNSRLMTSHAGTLSAKTQQNQTLTQIAGSFSQAGSSYASGVGQKGQAVNNANASLSRAASGQAASSSSADSQRMDSMAGKFQAVMQAVETVSRSQA